MKLLVDVLQLSATFLQERKIEKPRRMAEELLAYVLNMKRIDLYLQYDKPIEEPELARMRELLRRQVKGEPVEYIKGAVDFLNCSLRVDRRVLIPRPETEILAAQMIQSLKGVPLEGKRLWDICCGSGCLGIALKKAYPCLDVSLSDLSEEALQVARENAEINQVEVSFYQGDLLEPFANQKADYVLCNPPYISQKEYTQLDPSVKDFEPRLALVGGERGTEYYERLAQELPRYLQPQGRFLFEIGYDQGEALKQIFNATVWADTQVQKDWAGHPRFFSGVLAGSVL